MDTKEIERLATLYLDCIFRVAFSSCRNYADAEDVVQNTFMKLVERKESFTEDVRAKYWLIRVALNECNSMWRTPWKQRVASTEDLPWEPVFERSEQSDLYFAVKELPVKYRQVVHLYYFEDYSVKEIAGFLKVSETAVQTRLLRARQKLKESLKEK